jgi:hypothetical protein
MLALIRSTVLLKYILKKLRVSAIGRPSVRYWTSSSSWVWALIALSQLEYTLCVRDSTL